MITYWLYLGTKPIQSVRAPKESPEYEVKRRAFDQLDSCPGVVCDYPYETPLEHRLKISRSEVFTFPKEQG